MMRNGVYRAKGKKADIETSGNYGFDSDSDDDSSTVSFYDICSGYRSKLGPSYMSIQQPSRCDKQGSRFIFPDAQEKLVTTYLKKKQYNDELIPVLPKQQSTPSLKCPRRYQMNSNFTNLNPQKHLLKEQQQRLRSEKTLSFINHRQGQKDKQQPRFKVQETMMRSRAHIVPVDSTKETSFCDNMLKLPKLCGISLLSEIKDNKTMTHYTSSGMPESKLRTRHIRLEP